MKPRIPEDLSALPDIPARGVTAESLQTAERVPEDLSDLPDSIVEAEAREPQAPVTRRRIRPRSAVALLLVVSVAGLAALLGATEINRLIVASFGVHPALGWLCVALVGLLISLLGIIGIREARGYLRLGSFESLRESFRQLQADPRSPSVHRRVRHETDGFLRYLEKHPDAGMALRIERLRERFDIAENAQEWQEDIERVLLGPLDEEVHEVIQREAVNVGIGTAISPSGFLDAAIALWRDFRLIRRIAGIYRVRAGAYGTYLILRRTVAAAALADLAQEASVVLLGTTRSLTSVIGGPLAQGLANAGLTIRVGLKAQEQCRPLDLPEDKRRNTLTMLLGSVTSAVRRVSRRRQKGADAAEDAQQDDG